eukprot:TRINITY_DN1231_c0_g1_i5.p1 TRINITY_DN1231_c0_g1~~TRINITY_DN1231_c0_g1_i5.p1  ORF type:complete len:113 (+),score=12.61 TRINITY_DN1231_c0_g1_i5:205-543(+)
MGKTRTTKTKRATHEPPAAVAETVWDVLDSKTGCILVCVSVTIVLVIYHAADLDIAAFFAEPQPASTQVGLLLACAAVPFALSFLVSSFLTKFIAKANLVYASDGETGCKTN